ncbi:PTS lactose/cellobiose transporter subunit IIA [Lacticaseibacillus jixianensis]|uniref:PTS lactose/cellobiose transporter subunit IIA n=1 Tax=Lacticaseibacillus jixianensis TaxID=2486012 RepID=A0ABW4BCX6_9LACO|nr:PTS lactose/cellobiose transporter subunit IIA [Lacticaseibacillus jixianensis]
MDEDVAQTAMQIILSAGNAKSTALEAIDAALAGDNDGAVKKIADAKEQLNGAHNIQTSLMTQEMNGKMIQKSILLIHAQDQFMAANTEIELGERIIKTIALKNNK